MNHHDLLTYWLPLGVLWTVIVWTLVYLLKPRKKPTPPSAAPAVAESTPAAAQRSEGEELSALLNGQPQPTGLSGALATPSVDTNPEASFELTSLLNQGSMRVQDAVSTLDTTPRQKSIEEMTEPLTQRERRALDQFEAQTDKLERKNRKEQK